MKGREGGGDIQKIGEDGTNAYWTHEIINGNHDIIHLKSCLNKYI